MGLSGSIEVFPLEDVIGLVASSEKTGVLRVLPASAPAVLAGPDAAAPADPAVWFNHGLIVGHEVSGARTCEDAVFRILSVPAGTFAFEPDAVPVDPYRGVEVGPVLDRWQQVSTFVPPDIEAIRLCVDLPTPVVEISAADWRLLAAVAEASSTAAGRSAVNGSATAESDPGIIEDLVRRTGSIAAEVAAGLAALAERGLVVLYPHLGSLASDLPAPRNEVPGPTGAGTAPGDEPPPSSGVAPAAAAEAPPPLEPVAAAAAPPMPPLPGPPPVEADVAMPPPPAGLVAPGPPRLEAVVAMPPPPADLVAPGPPRLEVDVAMPPPPAGLVAPGPPRVEVDVAMPPPPAGLVAPGPPRVEVDVAMPPPTVPLHYSADDPLLAAAPRPSLALVPDREAPKADVAGNPAVARAESLTGAPFTGPPPPPGPPVVPGADMPSDGGFEHHEGVPASAGDQPEEQPEQGEHDLLRWFLSSHD